jgi:hypothetical protein
MSQFPEPGKVFRPQYRNLSQEERAAVSKVKDLATQMYQIVREHGKVPFLTEHALYTINLAALGAVQTITGETENS